MARPLDFVAFDHPWQRKRIELPTYPFQRKRYWGPAKPQASQAERDSQHPLLGEKQQLAGVADETRYENHLASDNPRWLDDHKVFGDIVFPGAAYVEMALAAISGKGSLQEVAFEMPLRLSKPTSVQTIVRSECQSTSQDRNPFDASNRPTTGRGISPRTCRLRSRRSRTRSNEPKSPRDVRSRSTCPSFMIRFTGLACSTDRSSKRSANSTAVKAKCWPSWKPTDDLLGYVIPPVLMDGAFQSLAVGLLQDADSSFYLPVGMERLECFGSVSGEVWSHAQWRDSEGDVRTADLTLFDDDGTVIARIEKLRLRPVRRAALRQLAGSGPERLMYSLHWQNASFDSTDGDAGHWMVVREASAEPNKFANALIAARSALH